MSLVINTGIQKHTCIHHASSMERNLLKTDVHVLCPGVLA